MLESCWLCAEGLAGIFVIRCGGGGGGIPALGSLDGARCSTVGRVGDTISSMAGLLSSWLLGSLDGARRNTDGRAAVTVLSIAELLLSWLPRRSLDSLSEAGFLGTGGTDLRGDAGTKDAWLVALGIGSFVGACTLVESRAYFDGRG